MLNVVEGSSTYVLNLDPSQNYSGTEFVLTSDGSGGTEVSNIFNPFSVTVSSGTFTVSSGQTSDGVLVGSGATLDILSGGTAGNVTLSGTEIISRVPPPGGVASTTTILAGGSQTDLGVTVATVVDSGTETVSSGATASNTRRLQRRLVGGPCRRPR